MFISLFFGMVYVEVWSRSQQPRQMDCKEVREQFYHYLGEALVYKEQGLSSQSDVDNKTAVKIVLTTPYCFPQSLIELAQSQYP